MSGVYCFIIFFPGYWVILVLGLFFLFRLASLLRIDERYTLGLVQLLILGGL